MVDAVMWADQRPVVGEVDTADEVVRDWMDQAGITDLSQLTPDQLNSLIAYINSLPAAAKNSPQIQALLQSLVAVSKGAAAKADDSDSAYLAFQSAFLGVLAKSTTSKTDGLDEALEQAQEAGRAVAAIEQWQKDPTSLSGEDIKFLLAHFEQLRDLGYTDADIAALGPGLLELEQGMLQIYAWLENPDALKNGDTVKQMEALLQVIQGLRDAGFTDEQLASLGLTGDAGLEKSLTDALAEYNALVANPDTKPGVADSILNQRGAEIMASRARALSLNDSLSFDESNRYEQLAGDADNAAEIESLVQQNLQAPWQEWTFPELEEFTPEAIAEYRAALDRFEATIPAGPDGDAGRKYIMDQRAQLSLFSPDGDPLTEMYELKIGLMATDIQFKKDLADLFKSKDDQPTADALTAEATAMQSFLTQLMSMQENAFRQLADSLKSLRQ